MHAQIGVHNSNYNVAGRDQIQEKLLLKALMRKRAIARVRACI